MTSKTVFVAFEIVKESGLVPERNAGVKTSEAKNEPFRFSC